jgi:dihydropteroate synthase
MIDLPHTVSTANMAEVLYLLDRGNRIIDVGLEATMEGPSVFSVRFEGERVEADHSRYLSFPTCPLSRLRFAFRAVAKAARDKARVSAGGEA